MNIKFSLMGILMMLIFFSACNQAFKPETVEYSEGLKLHFYYPDNWEKRDKYPAVLLFHGGGWKRGNPEEMKDVAEEFSQKHGFLAISAQYTLNKGRFIPMSEARSAMRYLKQNAEKLKIDAQKIYAGGGSAGGHIAASLSLFEATDNPEDNIDISPEPKALLLFNPAFNVSELILQLWENVDENSLPTVMFYGEDDPWIKGSDIYEKNAKAAGVACERYLYPKESHGFYMQEKYLSDVVDKAVDFLKKNNLL